MYDDTNHDHEYEIDHEIDERQEICSNETHELSVCNIRRFEMIKYSFGDDDEYVAIKEDKYDDLMSTSKDACRSYQEIFRMMDEEWMHELKVMVMGTIEIRDLVEIEKVNANCIMMANLQQVWTSSTQTDKAPVHDSDGSAEVHEYENCYNNEIFNMFTQEEQYTELLEPIPKPYRVQQNDSNVISAVSSLEQSEGTVEQHHAIVEATHAYFESLYNNLEIEVEKVNTVNRKMKETNADLTTELARYKNQENCFEINQEKYDKLERCYQKSIYHEQVDNTAKTRRPQPMSNTKINKVLSASKKSGCSKHMTGNLKLLINFGWKFLETVRFQNDHVAVILGYGNLQWENILIAMVYYVEGLGHNLLSVSQFYDLDLVVSFRKNTCFVRNLKGVDLLKGNHTINLYTINLHEMTSTSLIFLIAHATSTKLWLWHQHLNHLNFDIINGLAKNHLVIVLLKFKYHKEHLCPSCEQE
nr:retrovirus-related Pol polyprotein from transposon TNT 1-94 [Tanacetum cinerariifolium]